MKLPDHYAVLEVEPTASLSEIRKAYFRLAKIYHPDRQAGDDPEAVEHFLAIQAAYEVLIDPRKRGQYESLRAAAQAPVRPAEATAREEAAPAVASETRAKPSNEDERNARNAYMRVQEWLEVGEEEKAYRAMKAVCRAVPDRPEYDSLYGYLCARFDERLHAARDLCRRAVEAEPFNPDFHARLGYVYWKAGLRKTAEQYFAEALRLHPGHELARQYAAGGDGAEGGNKGLLGGLKRLFKR